MPDFKQSFKEAEKHISLMLKTYGFKACDIRVQEKKGTQDVHGIVTYSKNATTNNSVTENGSQKQSSIQLSIAPPRLELSLTIEYQGHEFSIEELQALESKGVIPPPRYNLTDTQHDIDKLRWELERLVRVLISCGHRFFNNDETLWTELQQMRDQKSEAAKLKDRSKQAEKAFKANLWDEVVSILSVNTTTLSKLDMVRLKYAQKKLAKNP